MLLVAALMLMFGSSNDPTSCLSPDVKADDIVSVETITGAKGAKQLKKTTVSDKLKQLDARCVNGNLVDKSGKEIHFYRLVGCWGNPPEDYQEILDRQTRELTELKKKYRVIELTCNPTGAQIN